MALAKKDNDKNHIVVQLESTIVVSNSVNNRITKLTYQIELSYFLGRAGIIRLINLAMAGVAMSLLIPGYWPEKLENSEDNQEVIRMMGNSRSFSGYDKSKYTLYSMLFGGATTVISLTFVLLLLFYMEVRFDPMWEAINQKVHVVACILSVLAGFCDVISLQEIQLQNCQTVRCKQEKFSATLSNYEEEFYPPYFFTHYTAFVIFLTNAMLYSIASRIWLRNED